MIRLARGISARDKIKAERLSRLVASEQVLPLHSKALL
jgi:hypothetical protein